MQTLCRLKDSTLVELQLSEHFPEITAVRMQAHLTRRAVLAEAVDKLGYQRVTEADVVEYAKLTHKDYGHWPFGSGRRFLMDPILKADPRAAVNMVGPYKDCGTVGYELGLWRDKYEDEPAKENFPLIRLHPVQLGYTLLCALVVKSA